MTVSGNGSYNLKTPGPKEFQIAGSFLPNGSSAVSTTYGTGFTVSRTGVGTFDVTITRPFVWIKSLVVGFTTDDTNDHYVQASALTAPTSSANGKFTITHKSSTDVSGTRPAAADVTASGTLRRIHFQAVFAESDVPGNGV